MEIVLPRFDSRNNLNLRSESFKVELMTYIKTYVVAWKDALLALLVDTCKDSSIRFWNAGRELTYQRPTFQIGRAHV